MISVFLNWIYILITAGIIGCSAIYPFYRKNGYRSKSITVYLFAGLLVVTVYAQIFSLFGGVGAEANLLLLFICIALQLLLGKGIREMLAYSLHGICWKQILVLGILFVLFAYGTSEGYMMYDSDLYHAQSIRWIEEFGVVPGLGNLQSRLAYNSAAFSLTALYSMKFIAGQSLHCVAGLMAFAVFAEGLKFLKLFWRKKLLVSDFARIGAIYYVTLIFKEMMSPASDYFAVLTVFYLFIKWIDLLEKKEKDITPYALLCILGVFAVTLKISAGIVLLLVLKPAVMLVREKRWKEIFLYLGLGLLTAAPYFIRNVIISGWLIYPYTALDFFAYEWKIPVFIAKYDAQEIQAWARGIYDVAQIHTPTGVWMKNWFLTELSGMEKLLVGASVLAVLIQVICMFCILIRKKKKVWDVIHLLSVLTACFLFWLFSAPMIRYGYAYPLLLPLVTFGCLIINLQTRHKQVCIMGAAVLLLLGTYRCARMGQEMAAVAKSFGIHVMQQDYGEYAAQIEKIGTFCVYVPVEGDRIGYSHFPSTRTPDNVLPGGEEMKHGFRYYYK